MLVWWQAAQSPVDQLLARAFGQRGSLALGLGGERDNGENCGGHQTKS